MPSRPPAPLQWLQLGGAAGGILAGVLLGAGLGGAAQLAPGLAAVAGPALAISGLSLARSGLRARLLATPAAAGGLLILAAHIAAAASRLPPPPVLPSLSVGLSIFLCGLALLLREARDQRLVLVAHAAALFVILNSLRGMLGLLLGAAAQPLIGAVDGVSVTGSLGGVAVALGVLASHGEDGLLALIVSRGPAGRLLRWLTVTGVALPFLVALSTEAARGLGLFGPGTGVMLLIFGNLVIFYSVAATYRQADKARRAAEAQLARANADLERRVAERTASLEEREAQLRAIGDNLPGAWIYSFTREPDGARFQYISAGVEQITGLGVEAVLANPELLYEQMTPESRAAFSAREEHARSTLTAMDGVVHKRPGGAVRWSRVRSRPRRLPDGQIVWDGIEIDITAQKEAEALVAHDRRYQAALLACSRALLPAAGTPAAREAALAEALRHLHAAAQSSRTFVMRNGAGADGAPQAELVAEVCAPGVPATASVLAATTLPWSVVPPAALAPFEAGEPLSSTVEAIKGFAPAIAQVFERAGVRAVLILPLRVAESWWGIIGLHACDEPRVWDEQETLLLQTGAELIGRAVQRWNDEDELRRREALLSALFDILPVGVSITSAERRPLRINRAIGQIAGMDVDEMLAGGHRRLSYIRPDGSPYPSEEFPTIRAIAGEVVRDEEVGVVRPDGQLRWVSMSAVHLPTAGASAAVVSLDITERKRVEAERLALERTLLEAQRLESLGILAGGVAHDFNNLLTTILGHAELVAMDVAPGSAAAASLDAIALGARRAAGLTAQMLAYAGRGRLVSEAVHLNDLADELGLLTRATLPEHVSLEYALAPGLPPIVADATQVRQVLLNLITNAAEALGGAGAAGAIRIASGQADLGAAELARAAFSAARPGPHCFLEVSDTGPGIAPASLARIFEPFYSTKFTGRGLGLAAVQGIMRAHGGALFVRSVPGQGASFRACFPLAPG